MSLELLVQKYNPPKDPEVSFAGKIIIVTGGSSGLGYEAALKFVQKGASKVVLGVRSLENGRHAKETIEAKSGRQNTVEIWQLEMEDYDSIKTFAKKVEGLERVDIVVLNAGLLATQHRLSKYGWETTLQVNVLSTALLAILLRQKLQASKTTEWTPVIEIVSSGLYRKVEVPETAINAPLDAYNSPQGFDGQEQYNRSKFLVQCTVKALAKVFQPDEEREPQVFVLGICPGACGTRLGREMMTNWLIAMLASVYFALFFRTAEQGGRTLVSGTVQGEKANGGFWMSDVLQPDAANLSGAKGNKIRETVWYDIVQGLRKDVPEVTGLLS